MFDLTAVVLLLVPICAGIAIVGEESVPRRTTLVYLFKPLTTLLIAAVAYRLLAGQDEGYGRAILLGLGFSLAGDVFLMLPRDRFLPGLVAFLLAHVAYLFAFTRLAPLAASPAAFLLVGVAEAAIVRILWRGIPARMRIPVLAYVVVLGMMAAQAISQWSALGGRPAALAAIGGVLFVFSDSVLAYNRFRRPVRRGRLVVLASYWAAQTAIALSILT